MGKDLPEVANFVAGEGDQVVNNAQAELAEQCGHRGSAADRNARQTEPASEFSIGITAPPTARDDSVEDVQ